MSRRSKHGSPPAPGEGGHPNLRLMGGVSARVLKSQPGSVTFYVYGLKDRGAAEAFQMEGCRALMDAMYRELDKCSASA